MPKKATITDQELNAGINDALLHELLDQLGAPKEHHGVLSVYGRLRRIAPILLADKARMDWLCRNTEFRYKVYASSPYHHVITENYAMGVAIRPVIDAAMKKYPNP